MGWIGGTFSLKGGHFCLNRDYCLYKYIYIYAPHNFYYYNEVLVKILLYSFTSCEINQVLLDSDIDKDTTGHGMPKLVYVSREKSKHVSHNFKAGALNVLVRMEHMITMNSFKKIVNTNKKRKITLAISNIILFLIFNLLFKA